MVKPRKIKLRPAFASGFTLIELVLVIIVISIISTLSTKIITLPVNSYIDLERRTALVDDSQSALSRMQRDIRRALPNSIRISANGSQLELLHTTTGGYYRAKLGGDGSGNILDFAKPDSSFDVFGGLNALPTGDLVIYNLGIAGADAYAGDNRTTLTQASTSNLLTFTAKQFPLASPQQRFFIVDTPITYRCLGTQLLRHESYGIATNPVLDAGSVQADKVASCHFSYDSGTDTRSGLVTIAITLADSSGERMNLLQQVHVDNAP